MDGIRNDTSPVLTEGTTVLESIIERVSLLYPRIAFTDVSSISFRSIRSRLHFKWRRLFNEQFC